MDLEGRSAVITGASRGLGAGLAQEFQRQGLRLALCARSKPILPEGPSVVSRRLDTRCSEEVEAFAEVVFQRFGQVDLWINNAGVLEPIGALRDLDGEEFARAIDINLMGVVHGTRAYVTRLRARGSRGVLINVSSGAGRKPYAGWSAYCAAKAGVDRFTECVDLEERTHGLRAYAVAPGIVDTHMQALIRAASPQQFPEVERFRQYKRDEAFQTPAFVAHHLLSIAFDPAADPGEVLVRLPNA